MIVTRVLPVVAGVLFITLSPSLAAAQPGSRKGIDVPPVPHEIAVPAGHSVYEVGYATGTQNYICAVTKAGTLDWTFIGPEATVFDSEHHRRMDQTMTHYLSQNPFEIERFRATWRDSDDSSRVWGVAIASSESPAFVAPGAISWLLLDVVGAERGPTGGKNLWRTSLIQRLNTAGGRKPTGGCTAVDHLGVLKFVPYTAEYYFYRAD